MSAVETDPYLWLEAVNDDEVLDWVRKHNQLTLTELYTRALVSLSRGGSDAVVIREFDMTTRQFVVDGFTLPEAKTDIGWEDLDTVLIGTDFGEGSLTDSGYPRLVKRWRRGTPLEEAETVYSVAASDVLVSGGVDRTPGYTRTFIQRVIDAHNSEAYEVRNGDLLRIDIPTDTNLSVHREWLLIVPRTDCIRGDVTHPAGSVLVADYEETATRPALVLHCWGATAASAYPTHPGMTVSWAGSGSPTEATSPWPTPVAAANTGRIGTCRQHVRVGTRSPRTSRLWQRIW